MFERSLFRAHIRNVVILSLLAVITLSGLASARLAYGQNRQLSLADILIALRSKKAEIDEKNRILADAVKDRGITFTLTPEIEKELDSTGARTDLISAIRQKAAPATVAEVKKPEPPKPQPTPTPQDYVYFRERASNMLVKGDLEPAVTELTKALEFKPTDSASLTDRALANAKLGKTDIAIADFDKAIDADGKNLKAFLGRAEALEKIGKSEAALKDFEKAAELDPANETAKNATERLRSAFAAAAKAAEKPQPVPERPNTSTIVSVGALNPYATKLAIPTYTQLDRRMNVFGRVTVQVTLDESGKVLTAQATEGVRSLKLASEEAIRKSTFKPVIVNGVAVKSSGYIIFNFQNQ